MTNGEAVSNIIERLRADNKDDRIPKRFILNVLMDVSTTLHSRKLLDKTLFREDKLFQKLPCVELQKVNPDTCGIGIVRCNSLMRSVKKLPKSVYSRFGNSVAMVTNIVDSLEIYKVNFDDIVDQPVGRYASLKKPKPAYFIFDDYLWIKDFEIEKVNVWLLSLQKDETGNSSDGTISPCTSLWDVSFIFSDKLRMDIMDLAYERIAPRRGIVEDELPNLNSNEK